MGESTQTTEPTTDEAPKEGTREWYDARARELGVDAPEKLRNTDTVKDAIEAAEQEDRYSHGEVLENARALTGYSRHHMAGALHEDDSPTLTKDQAKRLGDDFAKREQR